MRRGSDSATYTYSERDEFSSGFRDYAAATDCLEQSLPTFNARYFTTGNNNAEAVLRGATERAHLGTGNRLGRLIEQDPLHVVADVPSIKHIGNVRQRHHDK
jgi:hypothetical protein